MVPCPELKKTMKIRLMERKDFNKGLEIMTSVSLYESVYGKMNDVKIRKKRSRDMSRFEEGIKLIEESCGNGKDNVIALSTIAAPRTPVGKVWPCVRDVDAYYENGVFYITTSAKSNKVQQVEQNKNVGFAVCFEGISGRGVGVNMGWVLDPNNANLREKLRKVFADWYDEANNEQDKDCVILAVHITQCSIFRDHGAVYYNLDFINKTETE